MIKKKENVIFIVIDSLSNYNRRDVSHILMPFFSKLEKESLYFPNMFSEAPYTEAAVMSMLCGKDTLSDGGYFYRFKNSKTIFDYFHNNGYDVYNYIQPHVYPTSILRGNDYYFYNVCFDFNVVWEYRLYLYADLYDKNMLTQNDYLKIITLLDDNFLEWKHFMKAFLVEDKSLSLIQKNLNKLYSKDLIKNELNVLLNEIELYKKNKINYINDLLAQKKDHRLFSIAVMNQNEKTNPLVKEWLKNEYNKFFVDINDLNRKNNKNFRRLKMKSIFSDFIQLIKFRDKERMKNSLRYFLNYFNSFKDDDLYQRISNNYDSFKSAPSISSHFSHFLNEIKDRKETEKPFFSCIHIDDIHNPEMFFSYDIEDKQVLKQEFSLLKSAMKKIPKNMEGSVSYYLSLVYIDEKLRCFFEKLEEEKLLDNTLICITGDHGFSFDYKILRNSSVNNHYLENYNVPFFMYSKNFKENGIFNKMCSSKDILPTFLDIFNFKQLDDSLSGKSLFAKGENYILLQNIMGGCPDIDYRKVSIGILISNQLIVGEASKINNFTDIEITEYYNLKTDPHQTNNLMKFSDKLYKTNIYTILKKEFAKLDKNSNLSN